LTLYTSINKMETQQYEGTKEQQEEANENLSNIIARRKIKDFSKEVSCKRCGYSWKYQGLKLNPEYNPNLIKHYPEYIICPNCRTSVKLR
jgi:hypothetical protein